MLSVLEHFTSWLDDRLEAHEIASRPPEKKIPSTVFLPPAMRKKQASKPVPAAAAAAEPAALSLVVEPLTPAQPLPPLLSPLESQWLVSLLSLLDSMLGSHEVSTLRTLARTCQDIAQATHEQQTTSEQGIQSVAGKTSLDEVIKSCWTVVAAVWEVWGQRDLW